MHPKKDDFFFYRVPLTSLHLSLTMVEMSLRLNKRYVLKKANTIIVSLRQFLTVFKSRLFGATQSNNVLYESNSLTRFAEV